RLSTVLWDQHDSKLLPDCERLRKDLHDLMRSRIGGHVVVGRFAAKQQVADTSPGEIGLVSALAQGADDFRRVLFGIRQEALSTQHSALSIQSMQHQTLEVHSNRLNWKARARSQWPAARS